MAKTKKINPVDVNNHLTKINEVQYEEGLFETHKTGTPLDQMFSIDGGVPKATNYMIAGDPGVGKCVHPDTLVKIKIDSTGEELVLPIKKVHEMLS